MAPVKSEEDEMNENVPKLLCQMDNHLGGFDVIFFYLSVKMFSCSSSSVFENHHIILIIMMIILIIKW